MHQKIAEFDNLGTHILFYPFVFVFGFMWYNNIEVIIMSDLLTVSEAAIRLRVKPKTIRTYLNKGIIKGSKLGKAWLIQDDNITSSINKSRTANRISLLGIAAKYRSDQTNSRNLDDFLREKIEELEEEERKLPPIRNDEYSI